MKNGKAADEDGITSEFLKNLRECWENELVKIIQDMWRDGVMIEKWRFARYTQYSREGRKMSRVTIKVSTGNYRGIYPIRYRIQNPGWYNE